MRKRVAIEVSAIVADKRHSARRLVVIRPGADDDAFAPLLEVVARVLGVSVAVDLAAVRDEKVPVPRGRGHQGHTLTARVGSSPMIPAAIVTSLANVIDVTAQAERPSTRLDMRMLN